jgi:hypothetical protein
MPILRSSKEIHLQKQKCAYLDKVKKRKTGGQTTYRFDKIFCNVNKNIFNFWIQLFVRINLPNISIQ